MSAENPPHPESASQKEVSLELDELASKFEAEYQQELNENAIPELTSSLRKITQELLPEITKGAYSTIIGDDTSGRIPALMMKDIISDVYKVNDMPAPLTRFIAGSSRLSEADTEKKLLEVKAHIERIKKDLQLSGKDLGKALIVTDTIQTGATVGILAKAIKESGWDADIATISLLDTSGEGGSSEERKATIEKEIGSRIVYSSSDVPSIYIAKTGASVVKNPTDLFATPKKLTSSNPEETQLGINKARAQAKEISKEIFESLHLPQKIERTEAEEITAMESKLATERDQFLASKSANEAIENAKLLDIKEKLGISPQSQKEFNESEINYADVSAPMAWEDSKTLKMRSPELKQLARHEAGIMRNAEKGLENYPAENAERQNKENNASEKAKMNAEALAQKIWSDKPAEKKEKPTFKETLKALGKSSAIVGVTAAGVAVGGLAAYSLASALSATPVFTGAATLAGVTGFATLGFAAAGGIFGFIAISEFFKTLKEKGGLFGAFGIKIGGGGKGGGGSHGGGAKPAASHGGGGGHGGGH